MVYGIVQWLTFVYRRCQSLGFESGSKDVRKGASTLQLVSG